MWKYNRILTNARNADELAFNELYHQHWELLFRIACKKTDSTDDAYDLVHDLFMEVWRDLHKIPPAETARPYLVSCLYHKLFNYFRSRGLQQKHYRNLELFLMQQSAGAANGMPGEEHNQLEKIDEAISHEITKMPVKMKDIVIRNLYRKQSIDQIAGDLSLSKQTVKNQLQLASKRLRVALKEICAQLLTSIVLFISFAPSGLCGLAILPFELTV